MTKVSYESVYGYTSDIVVFTMIEKELKVLLVKRNEEPFKGFWALPGGFILKGNTSKEVAEKKLYDKTGVSGLYLKELGMFDSVDRDPRGWVISNSFYSIVNSSMLNNLKAGIRTSEVLLIDYEEALNLDLSFDHKNILLKGYEALERDMSETLVAREFLNKEFILSDLYDLLYQFGAVNMEKSNFFAKSKKLSFLISVCDADGSLKQVKFVDGKTKRPVQLYSYIDTGVKASIYK